MWGQLYVDVLFLLGNLNNRFRTVSNKGNPTVYLKHSIAMAATGVDAM